MQKDLENLAKEMQILEPSVKDFRMIVLEYWQKRIPTSSPIESRHIKKRLTGILSLGLTTDEGSFSSVVRKGIDAFMSAPKEERAEFKKSVLKGHPHKVGTNICHLLSTRQMNRMPY